MIGRLFAPILMALALAACDLAAAGSQIDQITVYDGLLFYAQNHERRRALREVAYDSEDSQIDILGDKATEAALAGDWETALDLWAEQRKAIDAAMPDLATVELIEEGAISYQRIRELLQRGETDGAGNGLPE